MASAWPTSLDNYPTNRTTASPTRGVGQDVDELASAVNALQGDLRERARPATILIAASDAVLAQRQAADYVCTGTGDQATFATAIAALGAGGGKLLMSEGNFGIAGTGIALNKHSVTLEGFARGHRSNSTHGSVAIGTRLVAQSGLTGQVLSVAPPSGSEPLFGVNLQNFTIDGNAIGTAVDGLLYRSYMGHILNIQVTRSTGHGMHLKGYRTAAGDAVNWDLYDSKIAMCNVDFSTLDSCYFDWGATDMHLINTVLLNSSRDNIHMVNAAGSLQCTGVHTYDAVRYNIHLDGTGSRSKFTNMKIEGAGSHGFFLDSTPGAGPSDVQISNSNFHDNGDATTNTADHICCAGTAAINRLNINSSNFGWKNSGQANKPRYGINAATAAATDWKVSGCSFGPATNWGTAAINKASSASMYLDIECLGTPLSVIPASIGSRAWRTDGGAATTLYVKESGTLATGWVAK